MTIFWFRRDLRLHDNCGLFHALQGGEPVLPIFIFDPNILDELPRDDARVTFIYRLLEKLDAGLAKHQRRLAVFYGDPKKVFAQLISENRISKVIANRDYEPYALKREHEVWELFKQHDVAFETFKDQVIFEKSEIVKEDGDPYVVYTPYSRRWLDQFRKLETTPFDPSQKLDRIARHDYAFPSLSKIGFTESKIQVPDCDLSEKTLRDYAKTRDFPAEDATSHLSPHLRFGSVSVREVVQRAAVQRDRTFLKELIWREFFMQILWHFPKTVDHAFRPEYDNIKWRYSEADFAKWSNGKTGFPMVDAGMRELNQTGFMHNRVRMVAASFLCKHLLLDWRRGEAYFALKLLDYEQSSNVGNWQWAAGSGVDAAPYFRIFNPYEQQKKFDADLRYVKKWIPEFGTADYPEPMVDHKEARERCLEAYKKGLGRS